MAGARKSGNGTRVHPRLGLCYLQVGQSNFFRDSGFTVVRPVSLFAGIQDIGKPVIDSRSQFSGLHVVKPDGFERYCFVIVKATGFFDKS